MEYKVIKYLSNKINNPYIGVRLITILKDENEKYYVQLKLENISNQSITSMKIKYKDENGEHVLNYENFEIVPSDYFFSKELIQLPSSKFELLEIMDVDTKYPSSELVAQRRNVIVSNQNKFMGYSSLNYYLAGLGFLFLSILMFIVLGNGANPIYFVLALLALAGAITLFALGTTKMAVYKKNRKRFSWYKNTTSLIGVSGAFVLACLLSLSVCVPVANKSSKSANKPITNSSSTTKPTSNKSESSILEPGTSESTKSHFLEKQYTRQEIINISLEPRFTFLPMLGDSPSAEGMSGATKQCLDINIYFNEEIPYFTMLIPSNDYEIGGEMFQFFEELGVLTDSYSDAFYCYVYEIKTNVAAMYYPIVMYNAYTKDIMICSMDKSDEFRYGITKEGDLIITMPGYPYFNSEYLTLRVFDNLIKNPYSDGREVVFNFSGSFIL